MVHPGRRGAGAGSGGAVSESEAARAHVPVLLAEIVELAAAGPHRVVVDGTLGMGGHAEALLERLPGIETYIGLDRDPEALKMATKRLERFDGRIRLVHATFDQTPEVLEAAGVSRASFALLDLGVSSYQLDTASRGFSFQSDGPIDMRMDPTGGETALEVIQRTPPEQMEEILRERGEVVCPGRVAKALWEHRKRMHTTGDLARVISDALPAPAKRGLKIHPATLAFMALRSYVNRENEILEDGLPALIECLEPGGRLAVISFHSLEDRVVKRLFAAESRGCVCPPQFPICTCGKKPRVELIQKKSRAAESGEVDENPRSRSARLRVAVRR